MFESQNANGVNAEANIAKKDYVTEINSPSSSGGGLLSIAFSPRFPGDNCGSGCNSLESSLGDDVDATEVDLARRLVDISS